MKKNNGLSFAVAVAQGISMGMVTALVGCVVVSWLIHSERLAPHAMGIGVMAVTMAAGFIGSLYAVRRHPKRRLPLCACVGMGEFFALLTLGLVFPGQRQGIWVTMLLLLGACLAVAFVGFNGKKGHKPRHSRRHSS